MLLMFKQGDLNPCLALSEQGTGVNTWQVILAPKGTGAIQTSFYGPNTQRSIEENHLTDLARIFLFPLLVKSGFVIL